MFVLCCICVVCVLSMCLGLTVCVFPMHCITLLVDVMCALMSICVLCVLCIVLHFSVLVCLFTYVLFV